MTPTAAIDGLPEATPDTTNTVPNTSPTAGADSLIDSIESHAPTPPRKADRAQSLICTRYPAAVTRSLNATMSSSMGSAIAWMLVQ